MNNKPAPRQHKKTARAPQLLGSGGSRNLSIDLQARALTALWTSGLTIALFVIAVVGSAVCLHVLIGSGALPVDPTMLSAIYAYLLPVALIMIGLGLKKSWDRAMQPKRLRVTKRKARDRQDNRIS